MDASTWLVPWLLPVPQGGEVVMVGPASVWVAATLFSVDGHDRVTATPCEQPPARAPATPRVAFSFASGPGATLAVTAAPLRHGPLWGANGVLVLAVSGGRLRATLRVCPGGPWEGAAPAAGATLVWNAAHALLVPARGAPRALGWGLRAAMALPHVAAWAVLRVDAALLLVGADAAVVATAPALLGAQALAARDAHTLAVLGADGAVVALLALPALTPVAAPAAVAEPAVPLLPCAGPWVRVSATPGALLVWRGAVVHLDAAAQLHELSFRPLAPHAQPASPRLLLAAHEMAVYRGAVVAPCACDPAALLCARVRATRRHDEPRWAALLPEPPWTRCLDASPALGALVLPLLPVAQHAAAGAALMHAQLSLGLYEDAAATLRFALGGDAAHARVHWRALLLACRPAALLWGAALCGGLEAALACASPPCGVWETVEQLCVALGVRPQPQPHGLALQLPKRVSRLLRRALTAALASAAHAWTLVLAVLLLDVAAAWTALQAQPSEQWAQCPGEWAAFVEAVAKR